jgi:hypothetical protein
MAAQFPKAAAARLRKQALADYLSAWQAKHGKITAAERAKARAELGVTGAKRRRFSTRPR